MTNIRRHKLPGQLYFTTHVTYNRLPILIDNVDLFWDAVNKSQVKDSFDLVAWVILPDHTHLLVDPRDGDLSEIVRRIKLSFSTMYRKRHNLKSGRVWQYRFWDRIMRDDEDIRRHVDYIHYNPVKHGLTVDPAGFAYSSFVDFRNRGLYEEGWGVINEIEFKGEFGE
jgi:putative transposase